MSLLPNSGLETHPSGVPSLNALINSNWNVLDSWANPAAGLTAAQAGATVTASNTVFTSENVGDKIRFASGEECTITATAGTVAVPSAVCTVTPSRTVASAAFNLYAPTTQTAKSFFARALTKKTKASSVPGGTTLIWNSTLGKFEPGNAESDQVLFMNIRRSGTNADLNNTAASQLIFGRNNASTKILANTVLANSQLTFEWRGQINRATGTITVQVKVGAGAVVFVKTGMTPNAVGWMNIRGSIRFDGATNAMTLWGLITVEFIDTASGAITSFGLAQPGAGVNVDMTADQDFALLANWSAANVGNTLNCETFRMQMSQNAN